MIPLATGAWQDAGMSDPPTGPPPGGTSPPPPDAASLREAALHYLARYATTEAGLRRVLLRRIDRWARLSGQGDNDAVLGAARTAVPGIVSRMVALGLLDDAAYASTRARGLALNGRSRRAITGRLVAKGIAPDQARAALPEEEGSELVSALILARKRKIGPFRRGEENPSRELGVMARAGFSRSLALEALGMEPERAEDTIRLFSGP